MPRHFAVTGAGLAGLACARTLLQAGHHVTLFEAADRVGGRLASESTPFGSFDAGAQYFTVRDDRFRRVLQMDPDSSAPWDARTVRVLDDLGRVVEAAPASQPRWVGAPTMEALPRAWAAPLLAAGRLHLETVVESIEPDALDPRRWQLRTSGPGDAVHVHSGFDAVLLAVPAPQAVQLLEASRLAPAFVEALRTIDLAPCWSLLLAFPQAVQRGQLGPLWNAAQSSHHRVAWLARESSKPGRGAVERWTVQASAAWSTEHLADDGPRVEAKLLKAFAEITGIRAQPGYTRLRRWRFARTQQPLGRSHLWDRRAGIGVAGDWCLGHRVEDAFVSGLELALAAVAG